MYRLDDETIAWGRKQLEGMTLPDDYELIYQPEIKSNECCVQCKKIFDGCNWSKECHKPVDGWIAKEQFRKGNEGVSYKIFYCPEFEPEGKRDPQNYDFDGCIDLLCTVVKEAKIYLIEAYKKLMRSRSESDEEYEKQIYSCKAAEELFSKTKDAISSIRGEAGFTPTRYEETILTPPI